MNGRRFESSKLELVQRAESFSDARELPLWLGNFVRLNSGGPIMMVVDITDLFVVAAWLDFAGKAREHCFPFPCVHRVSTLTT